MRVKKMRMSTGYIPVIEKTKAKITQVILEWAEGKEKFTKTQNFRTEKTFMEFMRSYHLNHFQDNLGGYYKMSFVILFEDGTFFKHRLDLEKKHNPIFALQKDLELVRDFRKTERFQKMDQIIKDSYNEIGLFLEDKDFSFVI
jgi:hypothetical protein